jgi:hypothetical protein
MRIKCNGKTYNLTTAAISIIIILLVLSYFQFMGFIISINESNIKKLESSTNYISSYQHFKDAEDINVYEYCEETYGVDSNLIRSIEIHESGHYTSDLFLNKNNTWGAYRNGEWLEFESREESTKELARVLKEYYFDQGINTIELISNKYCPIDSDIWADSVSSIYKSLEGNAYANK